MLEIKKLKIQYGNKEPILENFSLSLKKGQVISIVGESGCGKSTILSSILGLLPNNGRIVSGDIVYKEKSLLKNNIDEWRKLRGIEITMISQDSAGTLNPIRKIGSQFIEYIRTHSNATKEEARKKAENLLSKVNLNDPDIIMKSFPHQLSGGMKQRVGIAMALTFEPQIMLADEPTSALDVITQAQIVKEIMNLKKSTEMSIIMVTHNIELAAYMSDRIIVMKDGRIIDEGPSKEIINNPKNEYTKELLNSIPTIGGERFV